MITPRQLAEQIGAPDDAVRIAAWAKGGVMGYLRAYIIANQLQDKPVQGGTVREVFERVTGQKLRGKK